MKIRGKWSYLYRAVDREGQTVDFRRLSVNRDVKAAKAFFRKALKTRPRTREHHIGRLRRSHRAVRELPAQSTRWKHTRLRSSKYLTDAIDKRFQVFPSLEDGICVPAG
ncbi:DDE-type integrase/transposase/recombinase [Variovorax brevis]|uniref:DDE-type integrase/transposase/recombinase n=1 Tax=Variovorax brevis TaxID=3053503 RepID=UPI004037AC49